ncbi:MAG: hypothetical protein ABH817_02530, partial [archaeon]
TGSISLLDECANLETWGAGCAIGGACDNNGACSSCATESACSTQCGTAACSWNAETTYGQEFFWDNLLLNITDADTTSPYFTVIPSNLTIEYRNLINSGVFEFTDETSPDSIWINWTDYFTINSSNAITNSSSVPIGIYEINVSINDTSGNTNETSYRLTVSQNTEDCAIFFNESSPLEYPGVFTVASNCTTAFTLKRNDTIILNNSEQALAVGAYNFSVFRTDDLNYSNIYYAVDFVLQDTTPPTWSNVLTFNPTSYLDNHTILNITWSGSPSIIVIEGNWSGSAENYTMDNVGAGVYGYSAVLGTGAYYWISYANDSFGNANNTDTTIFAINKAASVVAVYLNTTRQNKTLTNGTLANFTCDMVTPGTSQTMSMWTNYSGGSFSQYNAGSSPLTNISILNAVGLFNITCNWSGNTNYSADSETGLLNVSASSIPNVLSPIVNLTNPLDDYYYSQVPNSVNFTWNVTDGDTDFINCSMYLNTRYQNSVNCTNGTNCNLTILEWYVGTYTWNITCNDSANVGNSNSYYTLRVSTPGSAENPSYGGSSSRGWAPVIQPSAPEEGEPNILYIGDLKKTSREVKTKDNIFFNYKGEEHKVEIISVSEDKIRVKISSEPQYVDLNLGEFKEIDLDKDGIFDIWIRFISYVNGKAEVEFEPIEELEEPVEEPQENLWLKLKDTFIANAIFVTGVIFFILLIVIVIRIRNKQASR